MSDSLTVPVKCVLPGCHNPDFPSHHFPELTWNHYRDTFRALHKNPSLPDKQWPIYDIWHQMLNKIFGHIPTEETPVDGGRLWRWDRFRETVIKLLKSFQKEQFVFRQSRIPHGERLQARIGPSGNIFIHQGNKRIALLQEFRGGDFELTVEVIGRSPKWETLKHYLFPQGKEELYHPLPHPDFKGWPISQPCEERWAMIRKAITGFRRDRVLDLGCHTGWFCRRSRTEWGAEAVGIDNSPEAIAMGSLVNFWKVQEMVNNRIPSYVEYDIVEYILNRLDSDYDVCFCLSVVMHLFKNNPWDKVWEALNIVSHRCKVMFFDCGMGGYQSYLPFNKSNMVEQIKSYTQYTKSEFLGHGRRERRPLYMFSR